MPSAILPTPTPDELDDLIYFSRTNDLEYLRDLVSKLCTTHACPPSVILASAIDVDADGLGSQSCLLHYPAANGNLEVIQYLLEMTRPSETAGEHATTVDKSAPELVNHKNVSGNTPLHWAGMNGHLEVVKVLVAAGADAKITNEAGRDAVVETEMSSKEEAKACAEWMLKNCEGAGRVVLEEVLRKTENLRWRQQNRSLKRLKRMVLVWKRTRSLEKQDLVRVTTSTIYSHSQECSRCPEPQRTQLSSRNARDVPHRNATECFIAQS